MFWEMMGRRGEGRRRELTGFRFDCEGDKVKLGLTCVSSFIDDFIVEPSPLTVDEAPERCMFCRLDMRALERRAKALPSMLEGVG